MITGLGAVTPLGHQVDAFWHNLIAGQCGIARITRFDPSQYDSQIAAEVKDFDPAARASRRPRKSGAPTGFPSSASMPGCRPCAIRGST